MDTVYSQSKLRQENPQQCLIFTHHKLSFNFASVVGSGVFTIHLFRNPVLYPEANEVRCDSEETVQKTCVGFLNAKDTRFHSKQFYELTGEHDPLENSVTLSTGIFYRAPLRGMGVEVVVYKKKKLPLVYYAGTKAQAQNILNQLLREIGIPSPSQRNVEESIINSLPWP